MFSSQFRAVLLPTLPFGRGRFSFALVFLSRTIGRDGDLETKRKRELTRVTTRRGKFGEVRLRGVARNSSARCSATMNKFHDVPRMVSSVLNSNRIERAFVTITPGLTFHFKYPRLVLLMTHLKNRT